MNTQNNATPGTQLPGTKETKTVINLTGKNSNMSGKGLEAKQERDAKKLLRKETNEARKDAIKERKDEQKTLSYHFKELQKYGQTYADKLSKETGTNITLSNIQTLKYRDFLPFLTMSEDYSNTANGWTFARLLSVVARYYRNEAKKQINDSILLDIE
jgi:hypothetical protein